ncbi:hypothetical protein FJZ31_16625 [Candidatus Poribacteria bacterium]|nr:hypothetical protein [Candidatus Poribacteria bacterium]
MDVLIRVDRWFRTTTLFRGILFVLAGITMGIAFAKFNVKDYRHASINLKKGVEAKPIYISNYDGKQVLAVSMKNFQKAKDIEIRMDGTAVQSWYPPVVRMPFWNLDFEDGKFKEVVFGKRLPLYLIIDENTEHGRLEIIDSSDGSLIQTLYVMRGNPDGGRH